MPRNFVVVKGRNIQIEIARKGFPKKVANNMFLRKNINQEISPHMGGNSETRSISLVAAFKGEGGEGAATSS